MQQRRKLTIGRGEWWIVIDHVNGTLPWVIRDRTGRRTTEDLLLWSVSCTLVRMIGLWRFVILASKLSPTQKFSHTCHMFFCQIDASCLAFTVRLLAKIRLRPRWKYNDDVLMPRALCFLRAEVLLSDRSGLGDEHSHLKAGRVRIWFLLARSCQGHCWSSDRPWNKKKARNCYLVYAWYYKVCLNKLKQNQILFIIEDENSRF